MSSLGELKEKIKDFEDLASRGSLGDFHDFHDQYRRLSTGEKLAIFVRDYFIRVFSFFSCDTRKDLRTQLSKDYKEFKTRFTAITSAKASDLENLKEINSALEKVHQCALGQSGFFKRVWNTFMGYQMDNLFQDSSELLKKSSDLLRFAGLDSKLTGSCKRHFEDLFKDRNYCMLCSSDQTQALHLKLLEDFHKDLHAHLDDHCDEATFRMLIDNFEDLLERHFKVSNLQSCFADRVSADQIKNKQLISDIFAKIFEVWKRHNTNDQDTPFINYSGFYADMKKPFSKRHDFLELVCGHVFEADLQIFDLPKTEVKEVQHLDADTLLERVRKKIQDSAEALASLGREHFLVRLAFEWQKKLVSQSYMDIHRKFSEFELSSSGQCLQSHDFLTPLGGHAEEVSKFFNLLRRNFQTLFANDNAYLQKIEAMHAAVVNAIFNVFDKGNVTFLESFKDQHLEVLAKVYANSLQARSAFDDFLKLKRYSETIKENKQDSSVMDLKFAMGFFAFAQSLKESDRITDGSYFRDQMRSLVTRLPLKIEVIGGFRKVYWGNEHLKVGFNSERSDLKRRVLDFIDSDEYLKDYYIESSANSTSLYIGDSSSGSSDTPSEIFSERLLRCPSNLSLASSHETENLQPNSLRGDQNPTTGLISGKAKHALRQKSKAGKRNKPF